MRLSSLLVCALALVAACASAQQNAGPPPPACEAPEYRQFDFWLGEWDVIGGPQQDRIVGHNTITRVATGCALHEHWVNTNGRDGHSLNVYDKDRRRWTQFWIGSDGVILHLQGGLRDDGAMAMEGELAKAGGDAQKQRIVWTPKPDGRVIQQWDTSDDEGNTWQTSFVGVYRRKATATTETAK